MNHATVVMPKTEEPLVVTLKGGPGSGHRGHTGGRGGKGNPGGSTPTGGRRPGQPLGSWGSGLGGTTDVADKIASDMLAQGIDTYSTPVMEHGELVPGMPGWSLPAAGEAVIVKQDIVAMTGWHANEVLRERGLSDTNPEEVSLIVKQWAHTSNDNDMRSLSLQEAAAEEFGLKLSDWQEEKLGRMQYRGRTIARHPEQHESLTSRARERAILRGMYNNTQGKLEDAGYGPNDTVKLFRGVQFGTEDPGLSGKSANYKGNVMESWTVSKNTAHGFGSPDLGEYGAVLGIEIPVSNIIGTARSGFGCLSEGEFVIFGNIPGTKVSVEEMFFEPAGEGMAEWQSW